MNLKRFRKFWALALALLLALSTAAMAEEAVQAEAPASEAGVLSLETLFDDEPIAKSHYDEDDGVYILNTSKASYTAAVDDTFDIGFDSDSIEAISWKSSNTKVATVEDGTVECLKAGTAKITVKADKRGKTATATLTLKVVDPYEATGVTICLADEDGDDEDLLALDSSTKVSTIPGGIIPLVAVVTPEDAEQDVTWKSSKTSVAKVSEDGEVLGVKAGSAKITATADNGKKATVTIVVNKNSKKVSYSKSQLSSMLEDAIDEEAITLAIKAVEVESSNKVTVTFIMFNGTDTKVSKLYDAEILVTAGYHDDDDYEILGSDGSDEFLQGDYDTLKVSCKAHNRKEFKLTFKDDAVLNANWYVKADSFYCNAELSYSD